MNTEQTIFIEQRFDDGMKLTAESFRNDNTIEITQWDKGESSTITLTHDEAYKLIDLIKTAMEVKI